MGAGKRTMYYGKAEVLVYRTFLPDNIIFALNVKVSVQGDAFLTSFTEGDNSLVVATDSMKNFILRQAAEFQGTTVEAFLEYTARKFLDTYPHMESIEMTGERIPFDPIFVPGATGLEESGLVFRRSHNEFGITRLELTRDVDGSAKIVSLNCGLKSVQLIKVKGSSFAGFIRDEYTTLPESFDRPLFIYLDIHWQYEKVEDVKTGYVAAEQIRDIAQIVFHERNSPSIQNLIYHIGRGILLRFPQLSEVRFESNNRTWETIIDEIPGSEGKVYTEPRPPYGFQGFSMTQSDVADSVQSEGETGICPAG